MLDTALEFVDRHGLAALSMRKLGAELDVEAMTLYYYVPSKAALLDALVDRVSELSRPTAAAAADPPADRLRAFAHALRATLIRHPGVLPLVATRPLHSADSLPFMESSLAGLRATGLTAGQAMDLLNVIGTFVIGHTLAEVGRPPGHEDTAETDLPELDPAEYPNLAEVVATGTGLDQADRFARAVEVLLAGFGGSQLTAAPVTR
ncbi:TetR/AcrR family transcriptional regulator [Crossiella cryophila]|uniref:AcrR family transcriptional regulator n=1 Tax=Crossiella cryophila TaxID=43355 RepID=A0A7W7C8U6_9PSEU|nr:TetR/AcrR family transcriptional regulator [Crossiella cryophila]MBB4676694.1 AcrR family transcriptional regulator [Crossiella cryophila]